MAQTILSIYITEEEIRVCEVIKKGKNLQVNRVLREETPKNSVDGGLIVDVEAVGQALNECFAANAVKKAKLAFTVASKRIASKEVEIPYVKNQKRIWEMIHANIQDYFPMSNLEEYSIRYTILDTVKTEETSHYNISLVAVRKELIASYYELAAELKLPVETVDFYGNSIYQLICRQMNEGNTLALQVDSDVTHVCIMEGNIQLFRRSVPHGRDALIQNFADIRGVLPKEAERILTTKSEEAWIRESEFRDMVSDLSASIARVVEFYTSKNQGVLIDQVRLFGEGLDINGLDKALHKELEIEVDQVWNLRGIVLPKKNPYGVTVESLIYFLPNLGALLDSLNLTQEEEKRSISIEQVLQIGVIAAAVVVIVMAGAAYYQNYRLREEKAVLDRENAGLAHGEQTYLSYMDMLEEYTILADYYAGTESDTELLHQMVLTLEEVMPQSVKFLNMSVDNGEVSVQGTAGGKVAVAHLIQELKQIDYITNVNVSKTADANEGELTEFEMTFRLTDAAADTVAGTGISTEEANAEGGTP